MTTPDLPGFRDAQVRLIQYTGNDVTFTFAASSIVYPPGTPIDPQTGRSLDPSIESIAENVPTPVVARAQTIGGDRLGANTDGGNVRAGVIEEGGMWLRIPEGTYDTDLLAARKFTVLGKMYQITNFLFGGMDGLADHLLVHGILSDEQMSVHLPPSTSMMLGIYFQESFTASGGQDTFPTFFPFVAGTTEVFIDGVRQALGASYDYVEGVQEIIFNDTGMVAGQHVIIAYERSA